MFKHFVTDKLTKKKKKKKNKKKKKKKKKIGKNRLIPYECLRSLYR